MKNDSTTELHSYSKKLRLFYFEKDTLIRDKLINVLEKSFDVVYSAKDTQASLEFCCKNNIDIVMINMEVNSSYGQEIARSIRKKNPNIPIVITTDHINDDLFNQASEIGIDGFLLKPIQEKNLLRILNRVIYNIKVVRNLHKEGRYFRVLTEASIVSKSDINGIITYVNDNLCKISGYTRKELIGKSHNIFRHPNNTTSMYTTMWETILKGNVWRNRIENLNKEGNSFLADTIIIPLKDSKDNILEFIAIRQDITEFVNLKREIKAGLLKKEEENRINEAKEAFLILFTHELKTPLNAIINFSKYMYKKLINSQELEPKKASQLLKSITMNANDMLNNVNNILDISKLQSNKLSYSKTLFSVNKLILSLLDQFYSLIQSKNIEIDCLFDSVYEVYSDEHRVKQIISNILSNAIKYGNDKIQIQIQESKTGFVLSIEDNGSGIKDKETAFNLYEQGNSSLIKRETQGTGVGLYFVKIVCNDLGIQYAIEDSKSLGGTRFELKFDMIYKDEKAEK